MNPPSEEGKKEPRGGLGVTRRVAEEIVLLVCVFSIYDLIVSLAVLT